jgi:transcriptional regulator with XRE-family HTH domain
VISRYITLKKLQARNPKKKSPVFERLEKLRTNQQLTWSQVAEKLGVKVAMLMMVKGGQRNLSEKVLAKLEWAEVEAGLKKTSQISDQAKAFGNLQ